MQKKTIALAIGALFSSQVSYAAPEGGQVAAGTASIQRQGNEVKITQGSDRAVINWKSFDIGKTEKVEHAMPSAASYGLHRVTGGGGASQLAGELKSNGNVFLVNPAGVVIHKGARIDVGGFLASTADIRDEDFMAGNLLFNQPGNPGAMILNLGEISVRDRGFAALVAPTARNDGIIAARLGRITLASGNGFKLDFHGDDLIAFAAPEPLVDGLYTPEGETLGVTNNGEIKAEGGIVYLTASQLDAIVQSVVQNGGVVSAASAEMENGKIVLYAENARVENSGTLNVSGKNLGETGGTIIVTGQEVALTANAHIDASGDSGGGTVLIGGDHMGGNVPAGIQAKYGLRLEETSIPNAANTYIGQDVVIDASAIRQGNGGKIVVWADDSTEFYGTALARGGNVSGNGGIVEISGGQRVVAQGTVDVAAKNGQTGRYLIDPAGSIYASTDDFISAIEDHPMWLADYVQSGDAIYILSVKTIDLDDYRRDPDGVKSLKASVIITKIINGQIVAQTEIAQIYAGSDYQGSGFSTMGYFSWHRGAISIVNGKVLVFISEKTGTVDYGQSGYIFKVDSQTLEINSSITLFSNANWGWRPYFDSNGDLWHFSSAGYYRYKNTSNQGFIWQEDDVLNSQNDRLNAAGEDGNLTSVMDDIVFENKILSALKAKLVGEDESSESGNSRQNDACVNSKCEGKIDDNDNGGNQDDSDDNTSNLDPNPQPTQKEINDLQKNLRNLIDEYPELDEFFGAPGDRGWLGYKVSEDSYYADLDYYNKLYRAAKVHDDYMEQRMFSSIDVYNRLSSDNNRTELEKYAEDSFATFFSVIDTARSIRGFHDLWEEIKKSAQEGTLEVDAAGNITGEIGGKISNWLSSDELTDTEKTLISKVLNNIVGTLVASGLKKSEILEVLADLGEGVSGGILDVAQDIYLDLFKVFADIGAEAVVKHSQQPALEAAYYAVSKTLGEYNLLPGTLFSDGSAGNFGNAINNPDAMKGVSWDEMASIVDLLRSNVSKIKNLVESSNSLGFGLKPGMTATEFEKTSTVIIFTNKVVDMLLTKWAIDNLGWQVVQKGDSWYSKESVTERIEKGGQPINWVKMFDDTEKVFTEDDANALRSLRGDVKFELN
ncbi:MAG: filamentous hemagglutinin N-terminal domain-containing protein [Zoogloeaceae bacterium]|jgi:filamentous hemagglutinin family protein|nr:filamentous hemagglutinin N-terminal domain-containing protein [Zoogloeaceae bacterium]